MATNYEKLGLIIDSSGVVRATKDLENLREKANKTDSATGKLTKTFGKLAAVVGGALSIKALATAVFEATKTFESLQASLVTVTGSVEDAEAAFETIQEFAKTTPFALEEVTQAFIKMQALGLNPSNEALRSYGDTASAMGKSLNQMVEAVADAATGEFERLKEFGIKASSEGDRVTFTFRGVATEVGKNSKEIEQYLINLGQTNFVGGMERQMDTLAGKVSNLGDQWQTTFAAIGRVTEPVMKGAISLLADLGSAIEDVFLTYEEYAKKHGLVASEAEKLNTRLRIVNLQIGDQSIVLERAIANMDIYTQAFTSQGQEVDTTTDYYKALKKALDDASAGMAKLKSEQEGLTWNQTADASFDAIDKQFADAAESRAKFVDAEKKAVDATMEYELEQAIQQANELDYWAKEKIRQEQEYRANLNEVIYNQLDAELQAEQDAHNKKLELEQETNRMRSLWRQKDLEEERAVSRAKIEAAMTVASFASSSISQIANMQNKQSKQGFENYKRFTKAQIAIDTAMGAIKAYTSMVGIPFIGPALAAGAAAVVVGLGAANMAKVDAQQFQPTQTVAYAKGGVVDSPTFFSTANSPSNVMGEAGAEAIMPLKRAPDGSLGVEAVGGGSVTNVNFAISAVDAVGIDRLLVSRQALITNMVRRGMQ